MNAFAHLRIIIHDKPPFVNSYFANNRIFGISHYFPKQKNKKFFQKPIDNLKIRVYNA